MHRIKHLTDAIQLLQELTVELEKHRKEINDDAILSLQRETRLKIKQLKKQLDELFPAFEMVKSQ
jgi:hypothetical protein